MTPRLLVPVLALVAAAIAGSSNGPDQPARPGPTVPSGQTVSFTYDDCKPAAPVDLVVTSSGFAGSVLEIEYHVTPQLEAARLETSVGLPYGGEVLSHATARGLELAAGTRRDGYARVRLTDAERAAGGSVQLRASVTFAALGDDGQSGLETQTIVHNVSFGEPELDLVEVIAYEGELALPSIEVPAVREDFLSAEGR